MGIAPANNWKIMFALKGRNPKASGKAPGIKRVLTKALKGQNLTSMGNATGNNM